MSSVAGTFSSVARVFSMSRLFSLLGIGLLTLLFVAFFFPWESVANRVAYEISKSSGAQIELGTLSPAITSRGPVLAASDVRVEHPAIEQLRIRTLEIAPRFSSSWFSGEPTLQVWADSELAVVNGRLRLGDSSAFDGRVEQVAIEKLPLRLDASGLVLAGLLDANANMVLAPNGQLTGQVFFESDSLIIQSPLLPLAIPFSRAEGRVQVLEDGSTRIDESHFEGPLIQGQLSGEIGMVHRSLSPPIDLEAKVEIVDATLRQLAPAAGFTLSDSGDALIYFGGTVDSPEIESRRIGTATQTPRSAQP